MNALKAQWKVTAGIIMGQPMDEYARVWTYSSKDYDADQKGASIYHDLLDEVHNYGRELSNPGMVNWVNIEFVWI
jgi:hypothetical protein